MAKFRVLVVDDEEHVRESMRKALEGEGDLEVEVASTVDEAEAKIAGALRYDVIVTDLWMGEADWIVADIVRKFKDKSTVTIVITAYGSIRNCAELMKAGAYDYIVKGPHAYERLIMSIKEGLEERARPKRDLNALWADEEFTMLLDKYPGKYIAILDQEVIAEAPTEQELRKKLDEQFPKQNPMIISIPAMDERSRISSQPLRQ